MIQATNLSESLKKILWTETVRYANTVYSLIMTEENCKSLFETFTGKESGLYKSLIQLRQNGYVTSNKKIKGTWDLKASKLIIAGYSPNKSKDTYKFYKPAMRK